MRRTTLLFKVDYAFDPESQKFFVLRSEVRGLHAEAKTVEQLGEIICDLAPELIQANGIAPVTAVKAYFRGLLAHTPTSHVRDGIGLRISQDLCTA